MFKKVDKTLDTVKQSNILDKKDFTDLKKMSEELYDNFLKVQVFRTRTEMEVSVLNDVKFPTHASKYWQSVREQNAMFQELVKLSFGYRKNLVAIKKLKRKLKEEKDDLEKEIIEIELEEKSFILKNQERTAKARIEELKNWSEIKRREANQMTKGELSNVDNPQLIGYVKRWINQSILMGGNGSPAERQNLLGQLRSGIILCIERDLIDEVLKGFSKEIKAKIKKEYDIY